MNKRIFNVFEGTSEGFLKYVKGSVNNFDSLSTKVSEYESARVTGNEFNESDNLVVTFDDYFSVTPEANKRLITLLEDLTHNESQIFIHNPTKKTINDLETSNHKINIEKMNLATFNRSILKNLYDAESKKWRKELIKTILYNEFGESSSKPMVILIYGAPGLGKTEMLKELSKHLNTSLLRIQLSNYHNSDNLDLLFGKSFPSMDLYSQIRLSNNPIVFLDEVDKVHPIAYNSFYQLFDEEVASNGEVEVITKDRYFIMTSNFKDENEIQQKMSAAVLSRIDKSIYVESLNKDDIDKYLNGLKLSEEVLLKVKNGLLNKNLSDIDYRLINKIVLEEKENEFIEGL